VAPADDVDGILDGLIGRPLDEYMPALVVRSARRLTAADLSDDEERELLNAGGVVLEVVFDLDKERWHWHLGVDPDDLPSPADDLTLSEFLQGEVGWRLVEWRDTREQHEAAAAPRLLRAS
jgi:hypothetical protein